MVDKFSFLQASPLGSFEFVLQVAQLVRPAALVGDARPKPLQGLDEPRMAIGGD